MSVFLPWIGAGALLGALLGPMVCVELGSASLVPSVLALALGSALLLVGVRLGHRPRAWLGPTSALLAAAAVLAMPPSPPPPAGVVELEGLVEGTGAATVLSEIAVTGPPEARGAAPARVRVALDGVAPGDRVVVRARLVSPGYRNESPHPRWPSSPIPRARDVVLLERTDGPPMARMLARARAHVGGRIDATLGSGSAALVRALVLGEASAIERVDAEVTRMAGLSHVLAVSGMHVTLVVGAVVGLLRWAGRRWTHLAARTDVRRVAWAIGACLAPLYAAFAGGSPSAWRAAATSSIVWGLAVLGRRASPLAVTGLVVVGGCVSTPEDVRSPAFVLSVVATAAVLRTSGDDVGLLRALVTASVRAAIATAPFTLWCFATVPPLGIVANLVVVPIVAALLLPAGTVHAAVASVSVDLATLTAPPTEALARAFLALAHFFAGLGGSSAFAPPDALELAIVGCTAALVLSLRGSLTVVAPRALMLAALASAALVGAETALRAREAPSGLLRATFVDVGQGDAALVDMPDGTLWLLDAGGASFGSGVDPGARAILPLLRARRRQRIDVVVVTHPHPDHVGGMRALLGGVPVGEVWDSGQASDERPESPWSRTLRGLLVPVRAPPSLCGTSRAAGRARIEVLSPCPAFDPGWDENDNSLVLRIRLGRRSFVFLGDAEAHAERALAPRVGRADVVKVGHHGSRTSSTEPLVEATRPWLAVISVGAGNRFGHPHPEVLARWSQAAAHVARTDEDGSVTVWTDGDRLSFHTYTGRTAEDRAVW
ncbi:MAG: DNA internalization-related competence protein ComEC/Rec2 [Sandaracinaceae bacterium]